MALDVAVRCLAFDRAPWVTCDGGVPDETAASGTFDLPMNDRAVSLQLARNVVAVTERGRAVMGIVAGSHASRLAVVRIPSDQWVGVWPGMPEPVLQDARGGLYVVDSTSRPALLRNVRDPVTSVAQGSRWCVVLNEGTIRCAEYPGAPLSGSVAVPASLVDISGDCGRTAAGDVYCWQGDGTPYPVDTQLEARLVALPFDAIDVAEFGGLGCAQSADGRVWCWGRNDDLTIAGGRTLDVPTAIELTFPEPR